jgi:hypothetical protein
MQNRVHKQKNNSPEKTSVFSTPPVLEIFDSPPVILQPKNGNQAAVPDLKISLIQAEKYGHHLGRFQSTKSDQTEISPLLQGASTNKTGQTTKSGQRASVTQLKKGGKKKAKKSSLTSTARAQATVANADQPLDPVKSSPKKATQGHGHAYHGYQTTDTQQENRVKTGITPTGVKGKAPSQSSRFTSPKAEAEALGRGRRILNADLKKGAMLHKGTGFVDPKTGMPVRHVVNVSTNRKAGFGVAAEKQKDPKTGKVLKDPSNPKQPLTAVNPTPIKTAKIIYEYVPSKGHWHPVTYYPN